MMPCPRPLVRSWSQRATASIAAFALAACASSGSGNAVTPGAAIGDLPRVGASHFNHAVVGVS
ncbi:MAG: hypothetical protein WB615_04595, partial [Candidatus Tumulicola sp.]